MTDREKLKLLDKEMLIDIICRDSVLKSLAMRQVINMVYTKIQGILDNQSHFRYGSPEYNRLENEYTKWSEIQKKL